MKKAHPIRCAFFFISIAMAEYFSIGKLVAAFGTEGEMILQHSLGKKDAVLKIKVIFLEDRPNAYLPYFVAHVRPKSDKDCYILLEDVNNREAARKFQRKEVWLSENDFLAIAPPSAPLSLLGFIMIEKGQVIGPILEVIEQPHQVLCKVDYLGNEALIPLHDQTLIEVKRKEKQVEVELPEGLLDLYKA